MDYAEIGGSRSSLATIGTADVLVLPFNSLRKKVTIVNTSAAGVVSISKGDSAALSGRGIVIWPRGSYIIEPDTVGYIWKGPIRGIADIAGTNIAWTEDW